MSPVPTDVALRALTRDDAEAFRALRLEALRLNPGAFGISVAEWEGLSAEALATRIPAGPPGVILGAFAETSGRSELVGIAGLQVGEAAKQRHKGLVWGVYVMPSWRRRGVAFALIDGLIAHARGCDGLEILHLSVAGDNGAARALYESRGFVAYGRERHALKLGPGDYRDEDLMARDLTAGDGRA